MRILISENLFWKLPFLPSVRSIGEVQVVCGNGRMLGFRGFVILLTTIGTTVLLHENSIVPEFPIDVIIGGDILIPH